jgi:hypothetical protein
MNCPPHRAYLGINTASIVWITPLSAVTSADTTFALFTVAPHRADHDLAALHCLHVARLQDLRQAPNLGQRKQPVFSEIAWSEDMLSPCLE